MPRHDDHDHENDDDDDGGGGGNDDDDEDEGIPRPPLHYTFFLPAREVAPWLRERGGQQQGGAQPPAGPLQEAEPPS